MIYTFKSCFANRIEDFIAQKKALGYSYNQQSYFLQDFDRYCLEHFPDLDMLTKEVCLAWGIKRETEGNNAFRNRITPLRGFAQYLNRNGETAYILPTDLVKKVPYNVPYIYTEAEISAIWQTLDSLEPIERYPVRHLVLPAMIKLLYCCGLRPPESRLLRVCDVDLSKGRLNIMESKQYKSRIVMMADSVTEMLINYNSFVSAIMPERVPFFPTSEGSFYSKNGLLKNFRNILKKANVLGAGKRLPRLYDFRHTFATHRLYYWMHEGKNINAMLPYLSIYMGHSFLSDTYYYIHLVPGLLEEMSGFDFSSAEVLIPEVESYE